MTTDTVGGVWDYSLELAGALVRHGMTVDLAALGPPPDADRRVRAAASGVGLHALDCRLEWMRGCADDLTRSGDWLIGLERRTGPDVVHVNGFAHAALPFDAPVLAVAHSCVLSWWRHVHGTDAPAEWDGYARRVAEGLTAADLVAAPTRAMLTAAEAEYGPVPHGRVIWNGRRRGHFRPAPKEPLVAGVGRVWDTAKNLAALDAAAPCIDWPVVVAGELTHPEGGPDGGKAGLDHVRCLGAVAPDRVADLLGRASIFALPARYEPFGLCVLEAAMSGCALVLGDIASLRELWDGAAVFVPPDDSKALGRALARLTGDAALRGMLARAAEQRSRLFTTERMADGYLCAYADVADAPYAGRRFASAHAAAAAPAALSSSLHR